MIHFDEIAPDIREISQKMENIRAVHMFLTCKFPEIIYSICQKKKGMNTGRYGLILPTPPFMGRPGQ